MRYAERHNRPGGDKAPRMGVDLIDEIESCPDPAQVHPVHPAAPDVATSSLPPDSPPSAEPAVVASSLRLDSATSSPGEKQPQSGPINPDQGILSTPNQMTPIINHFPGIGVGTRV